MLNTNKKIDQKLTQIQEISRNDIAIIGISVKLPMANSADEFWENMMNGTDCIADFPTLRRNDCNKYLNFKNLNEENKYLKGAFLEEIDKFDYKFFNMTPKDASLMEPAQRLFFETVWKTIEDAGYGGEKLVGSNTGVYVGYETALVNNYGSMIYDLEHSSAQLAIAGNISSIVPSRIAYALDLQGPTMVIDTACSSSLVAVHLACQSIKSGDCDMAIAGGIKLHLFPIDHPEEKIGIESSDYKTKSFDDSSDGTGFGEGVSAILLKPLAKAIKDKDHVYAVIKGSAINQDGSSASITAPNALAQAKVLQQAWKNAGVHPETISYIEAHGTGTKVGDPIEIEGIQRAFRKYTNRKQFCGVGSVKTNIGHLFGGAGIVSLIKVALALKNNQIPQTINFRVPNSKIEFENSPVYVVDQLTEWPRDKFPRRAGVNAFGFSGTNCHVIMEEYSNAPAKKATEKNQNHVFTISAKSISALEALISEYRKYINKYDELKIKELCYISNTGRGHYNYRLALIINSYEELKEKINQIKDLTLCNKIEGVFFAQNKIIEEERTNLSNFCKERIDSFSQNKQKNKQVLQDICEFYVNGATIDWESFYNNEIIAKLNLPTYIFDKTRCWIDLPEIELFEDTGAYYSLQWEKQSINSDISLEHKDSNLALFMDKHFFDENNIAYLEDKFKSVIKVELGIKFQKLSDNHFIINNTQDDYLQLMNDIKLNLDYMLYAIPLNLDSAKSLDNLQTNVDLSLKGLFFLSKTLFKAKNAVKLFVLTSDCCEVTGDEEVIKPENACLAAFGKIIERESYKIQCICIDTDEESQNIELIYNEMKHESKYRQIVYRKNTRYVEKFTEIELVNYKLDADINIEENGIYIITGGTGGIGLEVAKYLAHQNRINLVLVNRSALPPRKDWNKICCDDSNKKLQKQLNAILEIEKSGSKVFCYSCNVSNQEDMKLLFEYIKNNIPGKLRGVVHSAGVPTEGLTEVKTEEIITRVINPKIYGTWLLEALTRNEELDFFVMFSSVAAILGGPGQADYAAANAYLDSFASLMKKNNRKALTINWVQWRETGMAVDTKANVDTVFKALSTEKAINSFEESLNTSVTRVLIGEINYQDEMASMLQKVPMEISTRIETNISKIINKSQNKVTHVAKTVQVSLSGKESYTEMEKTIGRIWGETLGYEELNVKDDFFSLGGDSISAIKICNKIETETGKKFSITDALSYTTIANIARYLDKEEDNKQNIYNELKPVKYKENQYPLSSAQKRMLIINEMYPDSINYNILDCFIIKDGFDRCYFEEIIEILIKRHEILRTSFIMKDSNFYQVVNESINFDITYQDMSNSKSIDFNKIIKDFIKPFDLKAIPFRLMVVKIAPNEYFILFDKHHIVWDQASKQIFFKEFLDLLNGKNLNEVKLQYKDYAVWQATTKYTDEIKKQKQFWLSQFKNGIPVLSIPTDFPRPEIRSLKGDKIRFVADETNSEVLNSIAKENKTTLYNILLSCFYILLGKYSCQEDIVIGTGVLGRGHTDLEDTIGMFVNTLALRNYPKQNMTFREFLSEVRQNTLKAFENQEFQFEELVNTLGIERDLSRNPLFDVMFTLQNIKMPESTDFIPYNFETETSKYDLFIEACETEGMIIFDLEFNTDIFLKETISRMSKDYLCVLKNIIADQDIAINHIALETNYVKEGNVLTEDIQFSF